MKVVLNLCHGGFFLSGEAMALLRERVPRLPEDEPGLLRALSATPDGDGTCSDVCLRTHPEVVRVVEELGERASGAWAKLGIVEVDAADTWCIVSFDGFEEVRLGSGWDWPNASAPWNPDWARNAPKARS